MIITGRKPVLEALRYDASISRIYLQYGIHGEIIEQIKILAKQKNISITETSPSKLIELSEGKDSQGVAALRSELSFFSLEEILSDVNNISNPVLLLLDMIQDPHNLGAILRTAEAAGVNGVLVTKHNSAPLNQTVVKTSAGAIEHLKISMIDNVVNTLKELKEHGFWIVGSTLDGAKDHSLIDFNMPVVLIVGNEEKGIRHLTARNCDFLVKIPMAGKINSLNVSVATGILLFEILRQKKM